MWVLVGYATQHGSTAGSRSGSRPGSSSAATRSRSGTWVAQATEFVRGNLGTRTGRPVWLCTVGRLTDRGGALRRVTWSHAKEVVGFQEAVHPRDHRFFFRGDRPGPNSRRHSG
jgi:hypothetical protein